VKAELPFKLVTSDQDRPYTGRHVVEVHPAVALWRWSFADYNGPWEYKKDKKYLGELGRLFSARIGKDLALRSDDELDAWTAWYLARCWLDARGVILLGNARAGSFLMPDELEVQECFEDFVTRQDRRR
jgi:hypothetical protein